jgi:ABC-type glycerol-3-phosphate transport system substrate-binding protein
MKRALLAAALLGLAGMASARATTITIATVNNSDMIIMQRLSPIWEKETGNKINWVTLEENVLRARVTTDIATHGGEFDVITIGSYETPLWGKQKWLDPVNGIQGYDYGDLIKPVAAGLSYQGVLYALPFYAESTMTFYRKDLFAAAHLTMPEQPTYAQIKQFADELTDRSKGKYGICERGKPGWGENMAYVDTLVNTFGGRWFDMQWQPQLTTAPWENAIMFYVDLLQHDAPPGQTVNGANENAALFQTGKCAIWVDATSNAGRVFDPKQSQVADKTAFALAPIAVTAKGNAWFWAWALAIPSSTKKEDAAKSFVSWATSPAYIQLVGKYQNWVALPPGTRYSTYALPQYKAAAPFASIVLKTLTSVDPDHPTLLPVPYTGIQYADIPEFQSIGTTVGQDVASALAGEVSVETALSRGQETTLSTMEQAGYIK